MSASARPTRALFHNGSYGTPATGGRRAGRKGPVWPHFDLVPLYRLLQLRTDLPPSTSNEGGFDDGLAASMLGVTRRALARWRLSGIPAPAADRACIAIGLVPDLVWPEWHQAHDAMAEGLDPIVCPGGPETCP